MTSNSATVDPVQFLDLLIEFGKLCDLPDNALYRNGERGLDYLGLTIHSVTNPAMKNVEKNNPLRIVQVFDRLNQMVGNVSIKQMMQLKTFLDENNHPTCVRAVASEAYLVIAAPTFDLTISIE